MEKHVTAVAALFVTFGVLAFFFWIIVLVAIVGGGIASGDAEAIGIVSIVGPAVTGPFLLISAAHVVGGIALLQRRSWARTLVLIISFPSLLLFPIGTAYCIYAIWVLMNDETVRLLGATANIGAPDA
jgi:hypothetical protein